MLSATFAVEEQGDSSMELTEEDKELLEEDVEDLAQYMHHYRTRIAMFEDAEGAEEGVEEYKQRLTALEAKLDRLKELEKHGYTRL